MSATKQIMIVGVGGQGTLLASRILGHTLLKAGYDVKVSEVHGMSQRGGSVTTYVKYGDAVYSPRIEEGEADTVLAFELLEAARALPFLKPMGRLIVNAQQIDPMPVIIGAASYPTDLAKKLSEKIQTTAIDALTLAKEAGSIKAVNVVLIGVLARQSDIPYEDWVKALTETVPQKFLAINKTAFDLGYNTAL